MGKVKKLFRNDFVEILKNYDIGNFRKSKYIFTGGNLVYKIVTTKGNFILKVYGTNDLDFVKFQITLMEFLNKTKVSTPKIIKTKEGPGLLMWNKKKIAIQEFAKGRGIERPNKDLAKEMGKKWGILDRVLTKFRDKGGDSGWKDNQFRLIKWNEPILFGQNLEIESKKLFVKINKINKKKLRRSLIHSDLCEANFLIWGNTVTAIIDWDDAHKDYTVYEAAVTIAHNFTSRKKLRIRELKSFIIEYKKYIKLNNEEERALYYFIKFSQLNSVAWCFNQIKNHSERKNEILNWVKGVIDKYNSFNKISLDEFLRIIR